MGHFPRLPFPILILLAMIWVSPFRISVVESRNVPQTSSTLSLSPLSSTSVESSLPTSSRVIRSCGHHSVGLIYLEACNKNHKRSPFIIKTIFMEYYVLPEQESIERNDPGTGSGGAGNRDMSVPEPEFFDPIISALFITVTEAEEPKGPSGEMDRNLNHLPSSGSSRPRERLKRAPAAAAPFHNLLEKCCSSGGCGASDFINLC